MVDSLSRRVVISAVPTLAEEVAKATLALGMLSSARSQLSLPAAALATGLLYGTMESALLVSRCIPAPTELTEQLCAFSVLIRATGQALMTFCTMIAVVHRRWVVLGLLVTTHLIVNLTGLLNPNLRRSTITPEMVDFIYDAGRQVIMFVVAGLIALWLRRILWRKAAS
jgi:hypothetical protein